MCSLIACGVMGVGKLLNAIPGFIVTVTWLGAGFIPWLGYKAFRSALTPGAMSLAGGVERDRKRAIRTVLAVTLLNPYTWLDTVVLIGGVSAIYGESAAPSFLLGASAPRCCGSAASAASPASWRRYSSGRKAGGCWIA